METLPLTNINFSFSTIFLFLIPNFMICLLSLQSKGTSHQQHYANLTSPNTIQSCNTNVNICDSILLILLHTSMA